MHPQFMVVATDTSNLRNKVITGVYATLERAILFGVRERELEKAKEGDRVPEMNVEQFFHTHEAPPTWSTRFNGTFYTIVQGPTLGVQKKLAPSLR